MKKSHSQLLAERAETIYEHRLKDELERTAPDRFVAIEPDSGRHFLGDSLSEAVQAARRSYPDKIVYGRRIGGQATVHLGIHGA
jgi:hypothetical protein